MFERAHLQLIIKRIQESRRFIQILVGARQVGKTTLVNQLLRKYPYASLFISADAVPASNQIWLQQQWETARIKLKQTSSPELLLVIDEIQKIDQWSEMVKLCWDADSLSQHNIKVILLGSSRLLIQKGLSESLAGRFETTFIPHWSFEEMHAAFGWDEEQFAWFGGYPGSASLISDESRWKDYVRTSLIEAAISKDILMMSRVDKPALMKQLFEMACHYSCQMISLNKLLGQLNDAGNTTTLSHYLSLLDTAGLVKGLEKYSNNIVRKKASSPKFQVYNTALISAQSHTTFEEAKGNPSLWGRIVESAIGAHLLNHSIENNFILQFWREGDKEVDFIIQKHKLIAIEVKSGNKENLSGMQQFHHKYQPDKMLAIGNTGLSWKEFIRINPVELFD